MTSVTSRNSSTFSRYFQFCRNDLQKRTAITFSQPKVLQELGEQRESGWNANYSRGREAGGGGSGEGAAVRGGDRGKANEDGPLPGLDVGKVLNPLGEYLEKVW